MENKTPARIASFEVDHTRLVEGMYISRKDHRHHQPDGQSSGADQIDRHGGQEN